MNNDKLRNTVKKLRHHKYSGVDEIVGIEPKNRYGKISKKLVQENTALYVVTNSHKEDEEIIWNIDAETVIAKIHALTPFPGCYFYNNR